jgi:hypothetical protein
MAGTADVATDMVKGALAGAAGVWVMDRIDWWMVEHEDPAAWQQTKAVRPNGKDPAHNMADSVSRALGGPPIPEPHPAGIATHYAVGMLPAALYAVARPHLPGGVVSRGVALGLGMFILEDEIANPLLGSAAPPQKYPWQAHARGLVSHLVLGLVTEAALSLLDRRWSQDRRNGWGGRYRREGRYRPEMRDRPDGRVTRPAHFTESSAGPRRSRP